jgi:hypothetical protein
MRNDYVKLVETTLEKNKLILDEGFFSNIIDVVHGGLDVLGFVPVIGTASDILNGVIYAVEGDYINSGISFTASIPVLGDSVAIVGKTSMNALKAAKAVDKVGDASKLAKNIELTKLIPKKPIPIQAVKAVAEHPKVAAGYFGKIAKVGRMTVNKAGIPLWQQGGSVALAGLMLYLAWKNRDKIWGWLSTFVEYIGKLSSNVAERIKKAWFDFINWLAPQEKELEMAYIEANQLAQIA